MTTRYIMTALTTLATFSGLISVANSVIPNSAIAQSNESKPEVVEFKEAGAYKPIAVAYFRKFLLSNSLETQQSAEARLAEPKAIRTVAIDLNDDGQVEILAFFGGGIRYCAKISGCPIVILQKKSNWWIPITSDLMAAGIWLDKGKTNGYRNLIAGRAGFQHNSRLIFDGQQYKELRKE